jgi:phosphatidylserine/phosphatidylglycerophosphate/cardiolipin synthase-like enzyme
VLAKKSRELDEFRMIVRDPREHGGNLAAVTDGYRAKGFDVDRIRFQVGCHNKGIIADHERLMLGSHNITNAGLTANRDASVVIDDGRVCDYYEPVFQHDWEALAQPRAVPAARIAAATDPTPEGMVRVSLAELMSRA